jgi:hypothetical protein
MVDDEDNTIATSPVYETADERDKALEKTKRIMQLVCDTEGLHMIEHILLRPKGDEAVDDTSRRSGSIKTTYELIDVCLDECDTTLKFDSGNPPQYKFEITVLPPEKCIDKKRWKVALLKITGINNPIFQATFKEYEQASAFISTLRNIGSELESFKVFKSDSEMPLDKYFFRLLDENKKLVIESDKCYSAGGIDPVTKKRKFPDAEKSNPCSTVDAGINAWAEIQDVKKFLANEADLYCCEDPCDQNEDPYSFRVSFVLPCWPKRFRDKSFRRFVEQVIQSETPAHIHAKIYWLGVEQMRSYEEAWIEWLIETACNDVPDVALVNDFIKQVKQLKNCDEHCHHA